MHLLILMKFRLIDDEQIFELGFIKFYNFEEIITDYFNRN